MRRRAQAAAAAEYPAAAHCAGLRPRLGRPPCAPTSAPGARTPGTCGGWSFSEQASGSGPAQRPEPPGLGAHGSGECHRGEVEDPSAATDDGTSGRGARSEGRGARSAALLGDAAAALGFCVSRTPGHSASAARDVRARAGWGRAGAGGGFPAERSRPAAERSWGWGQGPGGERLRLAAPSSERTPSFHKQAWNALTSCLYYPEIQARA